MAFEYTLFDEVMFSTAISVLIFVPPDIYFKNFEILCK